MKLHSIELEGFGPFRSRQRVDFDAFDEDGIFLITGRTGAGKSSILDGVCYALYGTAPRYDGGDRGLRSDHCEPGDPTEVALEFSAKGRRLRVTRSPRFLRRKARGEGFTEADHTATLEELVDGQWIGRAAKPVTVGHQLDELVGLSREQFQQVMLLAQNRFADFLLARNDDRQKLLRTLFGTRTYQQLQAAFDERRKAVRQRLAFEQQTVEALIAVAERVVTEHDLGGVDAAGGSTARLDAVERAVPRARYRAEEAEHARREVEASHDAALSAHGERLTLRERQVRRQRSREALESLEEAAPRIADVRGVLDRARAAEILRGTIESAQKTAVARLDAAETHERARERWVELGQDASLSAGALRAIVEELAGGLAMARSALEQERRLPDLERTVASADAEVTATEAAITALDERRAEFPVQRQALEAKRARLAAAAAAVETAHSAVSAAEARLTAGRRAEELAVQLRDAEAKQVAALAVQESASAHIRTLLQQRLDGIAGELAAALVAGEPCAVCGALEHPHPAVASGDPVSDEQIVDAESRAHVATEAARSATETARSARERHAEAAAASGGDALTVLETALADATDGLRVAEAAVVERDDVARRLADLTKADADDADERERRAAALAVRREQLAGLREQLSTARAAVAVARAEEPTVLARVAVLGATLDAARDLADATDVLAARTAAAQDAAAVLDERLADSDFADSAEATAALLPMSEQSALDEAIRAHDTALATERHTLRELELELAGAPDEIVDIAETAALAAAAKAAWNAATENAARASEVAAALAGHVAAAVSAQAELADATAQVEIITTLADVIGGRNAGQMDLETFVLAAELEEIVAAANVRLDEMSDGRFRLQHSDALASHRAASGLGLDVLDAYTGQPRSPQSLSGGETFLASLALALGLAEVVTARAGGIRLDTLFIDEGFGSLDDDTLDLALRTLDELRRGGRTVGVISHVDGVKEQIPAQLRVESTAQGPSLIRQESSVAPLAVV